MHQKPLKTLSFQWGSGWVPASSSFWLVPGPCSLPGLPASLTEYVRKPSLNKVLHLDSPRWVTGFNCCLIFQATKAVLQTHSKSRSPRAAAFTSHVIARIRQKYVAYKLCPKNQRSGSDQQSLFFSFFFNFSLKSCDIISNYIVPFSLYSFL